MWNLIKTATEDVQQRFGINTNLYEKYVQEEILKDDKLAPLIKRRAGNFDWLIETPLGGAGTLLNACILYCLIREMNMKRTIETGVSGGLYTSFILAASKRNNASLVSLELSDDLSRVGALIPDGLRDGWQLVAGKSSLDYFAAAQEHQADLYVHDSLHTMSHMAKEIIEFKKSKSDTFFIFIDDQDSDHFWDKSISTGMFKKPGYDMQYISGKESRLGKHLGGLIKYSRKVVEQQ